MLKWTPLKQQISLSFSLISHWKSRNDFNLFGIFHIHSSNQRKRNLVKIKDAFVEKKNQKVDLLKLNHLLEVLKVKSWWNVGNMIEIWESSESWIKRNVKVNVNADMILMLFLCVRNPWQKTNGKWMWWFDLRCARAEVWAVPVSHEVIFLEWSNIKTSNKEFRPKKLDKKTSERKRNRSTNCVQCKYIENDLFRSIWPHWNYYVSLFVKFSFCLKMASPHALLPAHVLQPIVATLTTIAHVVLPNIRTEREKSNCNKKNNNLHIKWLPYYDHKWVHT